MARFLLVAKPDQKATFLLAIRNISTNLTCLILQLMRTDMVLTKDQIAKSFQHNNGLTKSKIGMYTGNKMTLTNILFINEKEFFCASDDKTINFYKIK